MQDDIYKLVKGFENIADVILFGKEINDLPIVCMLVVLTGTVQEQNRQVYHKKSTCAI